MRILLLLTSLTLFISCSRSHLEEVLSETENHSANRFALTVKDSITFECEQEITLIDFDSINNLFLAFNRYSNEILLFNSNGKLNKVITQIADTQLVTGICLLQHHTIAIAIAPDRVLLYNYTGKKNKEFSVSPRCFGGSNPINMVPTGSADNPTFTTYTLNKDSLIMDETFFKSNRFLCTINTNNQELKIYGKLEKENTHLTSSIKQLYIGPCEPNITVNTQNNAVYTLYSAHPSIYQYSLKTKKLIDEIAVPSEHLHIKGAKQNNIQFNSALQQEILVCNATFNGLYSFDNFLLVSYLEALEIKNYNNNRAIYNHNLNTGNIRRHNYLTLIYNKSNYAKDLKLDGRFQHIALAKSKEFIVIKKYTLHDNPNTYYISSLRYN